MYFITLAKVSHLVHPLRLYMQMKMKTQVRFHFGCLFMYVHVIKNFLYIT